MRTVLTNGRQFIIKVGYLTDYKYKQEIDQYGREICTRWKEYSTLVSITEFFPQESMEKVVIVGKSHCNYQDKFDKRVGKGLSYYRALEKMQCLNIINQEEAKELAAFQLDSAVYTATKEVK